MSSWSPRIPCRLRRLNPKRYSTLSKIGCIQGLSFSSTSPGRNPMSFPIGKTGRETRSRWKTSSSEVLRSPAAIARRGFPVPAFPARVARVDPSLLALPLAESLVELLDLHPATLVVLRAQAQGVGLDPKVGVLGNDHHGEVLLPGTDAERNGEDVVVLLAPVELGREEGSPPSAEPHREL